MFLLHINDLPSVSESLKTIMYANDTSFFLNGESESDHSFAANTKLDKVSKWMKVNKLSVNTSKTLAIRFTNRRAGLDELIIVMNGQPITLTDRASHPTSSSYAIVPR